MSYALYLWHQPIFAILRIESTAPPVFGKYLALLPLIAGLAWASTRFIEMRFRGSNGVSVHSFVVQMTTGAGLLIATGLMLHLSHGLPQRYFAAAPAGLIKEYNERIQRLSVTDFPGDDRKHILLIGNSRARDFGNVLIEAGARAGYAVVYREFLDPCAPGFAGQALARKTDILILEAATWREGCLANLAPLRKNGLRLLVLGPRQFGYSIEPWLGLARTERTRLRVAPLPGYFDWNRALSAELPQDVYVDYMALLSEDGRGLPLFDERGRLVSGDRMHLTMYGAQLFARKLSVDPRLDFLRASKK